MKLLFENWRKHLKEIDSTSTVKQFAFSPAELKRVNSSIELIINKAKKVLGASGSVPRLEEEEPLAMVAEQTEEPPTEEEEEEARNLGITVRQLRDATPEQIGLRKKYYGPEGELKKYGPRAVRGLEKGLGQMTAGEFEEADIVIAIPNAVLEDFRVLVESTKEVDGLYEAARDWYHDIRKLLDEEAKTDRDATLLGMLIATYSPLTKFALNLAHAVFMYKAVATDVSEGRSERLREYLETFPGAEKRTPGSYRGFKNSHKVPNFALNLIAPNLAGSRDEFKNIVYNEMYEWNSTIDTWMIDAFYPTLRASSTAKEWSNLKGSLMSNVVSYRYMARLVAQEAKKIGILPHELQALIWVSSQIRQTGEAGLGVTTQFAFDQIRDAIKNIAEIKNDLAILETLDKEDWLGTILHTIDSKGFESAARYILEPKKGVRSLTSRGKRGTSFKYFPPLEKKKKGRKKKGVVIKMPSNKPKPVKRHKDEQFSDLKTFYVMNNVIQMPGSTFNNLYDSITLYLDPNFSADKAVAHILGNFNPSARASKDYFIKEIKNIIREELRRYKDETPI